MHALVGANNAGKSTILKALDFLFNPTVRTLSQESFWSGDTSLEIRVEAIFSDLTAAEQESLKGYLKPDGSFQMARSAKTAADGDDNGDEGGAGDGKIEIRQHYNKPVPEPEWLQESSISGAAIKGWWASKGTLTANGLDFGATLGGKAPGVEAWKEAARTFLAANEGRIPTKDTWIDNPKGYANVLKGVLPFFVLVPAVRDVADESKPTKSSPFGRLLSAILDTVADDKKAQIESMLEEIGKHMNRCGGEQRIPLITKTEERLNQLLQEVFRGCDLEIEFTPPTLEVLMSTPKVYVDDGCRNAIENKGHGVQRAVIFAILRAYAEHMSSYGDKKRNLILAVEEPELYMHPQAQRTIRQVFRKIVSSGDQVIFSTHSALLVDVSCFDEIVRMESSPVTRGTTKTAVSVAYQLPVQKLIDDLVARHPKAAATVTADSIRDRYSHAYNPHRNEGFFASRILLVEGLTEEYSLPIYADAIEGCEFDPNGISVVECGGKDSMDRLYRIFNGLHIPCFMLFDYDSGNPKAIEKSKELIALVGATVNDPPQAMFVCDDIACFPRKWESDLANEIPNASALAKEARAYLGLADDDGKPLVARYIARKVTSVASPAVPASIDKVIRKVNSVGWKCSCLRTASEAATSNAS
jgi:energy-coupling factor transporter ATP-binding protein EcfA2